MRRFHLVIALVVALATNFSLRAAAYRWHWGGPYGRWAAGPAGRFGHRPWGWHRAGFGPWGEPGAPAPTAPPAGPAAAPPVAPPAAAPAPVSPAAPQPQ